jgi:hypothetical protein
MIRVSVTLMAAAMCMFAAGCGANGDPYQALPVPASKSAIYIYRPYTVLSAEAAPMITCGHESIELYPGGYYSFIEESGPITCGVATDASAVRNFDAPPGEEYFIREDVASALQGGRTQLTVVSSAVGQDEIANCRLQGIKH